VLVAVGRPAPPMIGRLADRGVAVAVGAGRLAVMVTVGVLLAW